MTTLDITIIILGAWSGLVVVGAVFYRLLSPRSGGPVTTLLEPGDMAAAKGRQR